MALTAIVQALFFMFLSITEYLSENYQLAALFFIIHQITLLNYQLYKRSEADE